MTQSLPQINPNHDLQPDVLQRRASDPTKSVWVGASAGSGKTKVLADRVLRLLLTDVLPHKILCLTFTRATAAQMAIRVTAELSEWATCDEDVLADKLFKLENKIPNAQQMDRARQLFARVLNDHGGLRIRTIHSFAQEILSRFPIEAGLPPLFSVLDESDAKIIFQESLHGLLTQITKQDDGAEKDALHLLTSDMAEGTITGLFSEILHQKNRLKQAGVTLERLDEIVSTQRAALGFGAHETMQSIKQSVLDDVPRSLLREIGAYISTGSPSFAPRGKAMMIFADQKMGSFDAYASFFLTQEGTIRKGWVNKKKAEERPELFAFMNAEADKILKVTARLETLRWIAQGEAALRLALVLDQKYRDAKAARAVLDYDDLIHACENLLHRADIAQWVLFKLDQGIDHILLDEAQDTSPTQWGLVKILVDAFFDGSGARAEVNRSLFVVGDEKQSIYSFLDADPAEFARMRSYFRDLITNATENGYREEPLNISFRSAPAILRAVDQVFADESVRRGVSIVPVQHKAWRWDAAGRVEVWDLIRAEKKKKAKVKGEEPAPEEDWAPRRTYEYETNPSVLLANKIADRIRGWLDDGAKVRGRAINAGDIMVLVRRRNAFVDHLVRALKKNNIPVSGVDRMALTDQLAVMDLMALLRFMLLPQDDLNLAALMRGPLLGLSEEDLMQVAMGRQGDLWSALQQSSHCAQATDYLALWLARADQGSPFTLLEEILNTPCPADNISGRRALWKRLGADALDPIDELLNSAESFSSRHAPSLQSFLYWLTATTPEIKRELDQSGGMVRITTVHASKGLEAPIVFLPDTTGLPEKRKLSKLMWDDELGVPFYVPRTPKDERLSLLYADLWRRQMEEYRRLLYVALTRPADQLYVCGFTTDRADATGQNWYALVANALKDFDTPYTHVADELIAFADPVLNNTLQTTDGSSTQPTQDLPSWFFQKAPQEVFPPRPLVPSHPSEPEPSVATPQDSKFHRGLIMHRLLQNLPDVPKQDRHEKMVRFLSNPQHGLTPDQRQEIENELTRLMNQQECAALFDGPSKAEVPLVGVVKGRVISGQVDRLCLVGDEVWVIDYKTNRPPPTGVEGVPLIYRQQLAAYHAVLTRLYVGKKVRCFLLWTYVPRLMEVEQEFLSLP